MANKLKINKDFLSKNAVKVTEETGKLAELYEQLMNIAEAIYNLREKPMKKTALITDHIILRIEELK